MSDEAARLREIAARIQARIDPHNGATHHAECWRDHDACALRRAADLLVQAVSPPQTRAFDLPEVQAFLAQMDTDMGRQDQGDDLAGALRDAAAPEDEPPPGCMGDGDGSEPPMEFVQVSAMGGARLGVAATAEPPEDAAATIARLTAALDGVRAGRDVLAAETGRLTRDLCTVIDERDAALAQVITLDVCDRCGGAIAGDVTVLCGPCIEAFTRLLHERDAAIARAEQAEVAGAIAEDRREQAERRAPAPAPAPPACQTCADMRYVVEKFDDKPHQLFSALLKWFPAPEVTERLNRCYENIGRWLAPAQASPTREPGTCATCRFIIRDGGDPFCNNGLAAALKLSPLLHSSWGCSLHEPSPAAAQEKP